MLLFGIRARVVSDRHLIRRDAIWGENKFIQPCPVLMMKQFFIKIDMQAIHD